MPRGETILQTDPKPILGLSTIQSASFLALFRDYGKELVQAGSNPHMARLHLRSVVHLGAWLELEGVARESVDEQTVPTLDRHRSSCSVRARHEFAAECCPRMAGAEAFVHTSPGVLYAGRRRPAVLRIHAVSPALFTPLPKSPGLKVVLTQHGRHYEREKWSALAKAVLRNGERFGVLFSDARIVISGVIRGLAQRKYARSLQCIPDSVEIPGPISRRGPLTSFGLERDRCFLSVAACCRRSATWT